VTTRSTTRRRRRKPDAEREVIIRAAELLPPGAKLPDGVCRTCGGCGALVTCGPGPGRYPCPACPACAPPAHVVVGARSVDALLHRESARREFWSSWCGRAQTILGALLADTTGRRPSEDPAIAEVVEGLIAAEQALTALLGR
jgi:hypothetical protein